MIESLVVAGMLMVGQVTADRSEAAQLPQVHSVATEPQMKGVRSSSYRGKWFKSRFEATRMCIVRRESSGVYSATSRTGKYRGAYQVSPELRVGMGWMIQKELRAAHVPNAAEIGRTLRATPMNRWARYWQDFGFWVTFNHDGHRSGAQHWAGGRWSCATR